MRFGVRSTREYGERTRSLIAGLLSDWASASADHFPGKPRYRTSVYGESMGNSRGITRDKRRFVYRSNLNAPGVGFGHQSYALERVGWKQ